MKQSTHSPGRGRSLIRCRSWFVAIASIAGLSLLLSACGSTGGSESGAQPKGPSGEPIKLGVVGSYTGPLASLLAVSKPTIEAWADSVNAAGGINGRPIRLYIKDDGHEASKSVAAVKELVENDHVVAIVGQAADGGSTVWARYVDSKGIPVIGGENSDPPYFTDANFFDPVGSFLSVFYGIAARAHDAGGKFGALYCAESPACAQVVPLMTALGASPETALDVAYSGKVLASAPDYTSQCQALKASGAEAYSLSVAIAVQQRIAQQCKQQGVKATIVNNVPDSTLNSNPAFEGMQLVTGSFPFSDKSIPATKEFHAALEKYAPEVGSAQMPLNYIAADVWMGGKLFEAAVKASGSTEITSESIKKGLYALDGETLGGLSAPLTFKPGQPNLNNSYFQWDVKGGEFVVPNMTPIKVPDEPIAAILKAFAK